MTPANYQQFVRMVAAFTRQGEQDPEGHTVGWDADNELETLHNIIGIARDLCGMPSPPDGGTPCPCPDCTLGALR